MDLKRTINIFKSTNDEQELRLDNHSLTTDFLFINHVSILSKLEDMDLKRTINKFKSTNDEQELRLDNHSLTTDVKFINHLCYFSNAHRCRFVRDNK